MLLVFIGFTMPAFAGDNEGFYIGAQGGINLLNTENYFSSTGTHSVKFDYDSEWAAGIVLGCDFGKFSTELEFTRRNSSLDTLTVITDGGIGAALGSLGILADCKSAVFFIQNPMYLAIC